MRQPAPRLQPRPRRLRVHRGALRQGRHPAVPLHLPQEHRGRRHRGHLHAGLPHEAGGVRRAVREVAEGALQALPRQAAARGTTARTSRPTRRRRASPRSSPSRPAPPARWWPPSPATARRAKPTSSCSPPGTAAVIKNLTKGYTGRVREHHHERRLRGRALHRLRPQGRHRRLLRAQGEAAQPVPRLRAHGQDPQARAGASSTRPSRPACCPTDAAPSSPPSRRASPTSGCSTSRRAR